MNIKLDNLAHDEERYVRYIDLNKSRPGNWQYVDVDRLTADIEQEQTQKWIALRRRERIRQKAKKRAMLEVAVANMLFRVIGAALIFIGYSSSMWLHEGGPIIVLGLLGLILIFGPASNKKENQEKLYKKYKEEYKNEYKSRNCEEDW